MKVLLLVILLMMDNTVIGNSIEFPTILTCETAKVEMGLSLPAEVKDVFMQCITLNGVKS